MEFDMLDNINRTIPTAWRKNKLKSNNKINETTYKTSKSLGTCLGFAKDHATK